jgi:dihydrofolate synthase/folylpolyglutamate synthase
MRTSDQLLAELRTLHPKLIDLSLGRIERLLVKLGNPEARLPPVIHVAGTNGKGSTVAYLKAMLQAAGKRVHVYTSPHLVRFSERIELAGADGKARPIGEAELVDVLARTQRANAGDAITFFEITTAAAFQAFAEHPADAVILEVGLGGRLDTTNVVERPALSVITPVSLDHQDKLGATLGAIAGEKAGILKAGVPAVVSRQPPEALDVIRARAEEVRAPLFLWGEDYEAFEQRGRLVYQSAERLMDLSPAGADGPPPDRQCRHRHRRGAAAEISRRRRSRHRARAPRRALAGAHAAARQRARCRACSAPAPSCGSTARTIRPAPRRSPRRWPSWRSGRPSRGPDHRHHGPEGLPPAFLAHFRGLARRVVAVPIPGAHEATHDPVALAKMAASVGLAADAAPDVEAAIARLQKVEAAPLRILICGSLYLAGHVLALQEGVQAQMN